ncbi:MAG: toll/interleukin-1 receptor domain-containing protein [Lachnospiraceae bacterium]|nr:toll/interleukin-1 receptor domain-containing protein [Lachnospiraceae bacterium]
MYTGFNLRLDETASIFGELKNYMRLQKIGETHLSNQKANYEKDLKKYVRQKEIDGTKIQNEWFPQINADIFISHSHKDKELACAFAGWINEKFGLKCFIDSIVWGYSNELLDEMNSRLSNKRKDDNGGYLYEHQSCNQVSQHVNTMLSIALQKMIDKVEAVIFINTDNTVKVCSDTRMEKTYSPWIYSEIICTQFVRKKPLLAYRDYKSENKTYMGVFESMQFAMHTDISYIVSLKHLKTMGEEDLIQWEKEYSLNGANYEYALDALYKFMRPNEVESTRKLFSVLEDGEIKTLQHAYSTQDTEAEEWEDMQYVWNCIIQRCILCCQECDRYRKALNE